MFKKILGILAVSLLSFFPQLSQAELSGYMTDEQALSINCTTSICLSKLSIKKKTYTAGYTSCASYSSTGACQSSSAKFIFSVSPMEVIMMSLNRQIEIEAPNQAGKIVGFDDCKIDLNNDGNASCRTISSVWGPNYINGGPGWMTSYGSRAGTSVFRQPQSCPGSASKYVPGKGCVIDSWSDGQGNIYKAQRTPLVGSGTCDVCAIDQIKEAKSMANLIVGNPVDVNSGAKIDSITDINFPIPFTRTYSSLRTDYGTLGGGWKHNFSKKIDIVYDSINNIEVAIGLTVKEENDEEIFFSRDNDTLPFTATMADHKGYSMAVVSNQYVLSAPNGNKEYYDTSGKLIKMLFKNGYFYDFTYNVLNLLSIVTDSYGKSLTLIYSDYADIITQVNSSNGDYVKYTYLAGLMTEAKFNNQETLGYAYTNTLLTSKIDANGNTYALYTYDLQKRATEVKHVSSLNNYVSRYQYAYTDTSVTVTLPDNSIMSVTLVQKNYRKTAGTVQMPGQYVKSLQYDSNGNISGYSKQLYVGASYTYDTTNNVLIKANYRGTITNYNWDMINRRINSYTETTTSLVKNYILTYDTNGNVIQKQLTISGLSRVWNYTYSTFGKMLTMTDPLGATTTFTYYSDTDSNINNRGLPYTITNTLGHTVTINSYNVHGKPTSMSLPNGLSKTMTYDLRGRMLSETMTGNTNNYTYNPSGDMTSVTFGNGYILNMSYDMDHRMTSMSDNRGNNVVYTLDNNGNITNESEYTGSTLVSVKNRIFDSMSRMTQFSRSYNAFPTTYVYDDYDRVISVTNPNNEAQTITYNDKDDVIGMSGLGRNQNFTRDYDSNITSLNQQGNTTNFTYNALGEMLTMVSPDSGSHSYSNNISTKTKTHTDSLGTVETSLYDSLGRVTNVSRGVNTESYLWDTVKAGKLTSVTDASGSITYGYDANARLNSKTQLTGSYSKVVGYAYDSAGQMNKITYPSGMEVNYSYTAGLVSSIQVGTSPLLSSIGYKGFNSTPLSWTWSNNNNRQLGINVDDRLIGLGDSSIINQSLAQNNKGNVISSSESVNTNNSFTATYAPDEQVTSFNHALGNKAYTQDTKFKLLSVSPYDANSGSKLWFQSSSSSNNRVTSLYYQGTVVSIPTQYTSYDVKGNLLTDGKGGVFTYDLANNMATGNKGVPATYSYNALHQRVAKTVTVGGVATTTYFVYNEEGLLLGEYDSAGNTIAEHIYLNGIPVAVVKGGATYYVHTDYLGTPRAVSSYSGVVMWKWDNTNAYGNNLANETVSGSTFEYNLRFSGQYFDKETALHYNYYRMYNPELGRYMQPDPIGVNGGMNVYSYVENNPLNAVDTYGLRTVNMGLGEGFAVEQFIKTNNPFDRSDTLRILAHGSPLTVSGKNAKDLADEIKFGKFNTKTGILYENYFQERLKNNLDVNIVLDACDTASYAREKNGNIIKPYAYELGFILKKYIDDAGSTSKLNIKAPNGTAVWGLGIDYIHKPSYSSDINGSQGKVINFDF